mgnify:CR=1 FL=1
MNENREILVFPREYIEGYKGLVSFQKMPSREQVCLMQAIEVNRKWLLRDQAEMSVEWVQAIPCTLILNTARQYCVLRRVSTGREDLRARLTLTFGGHVDHVPNDNSMSLASVLKATLLRELQEELGVEHNSVVEMKQIGLVIDAASIMRSRHIAFLYETVVNQQGIKPKAREEFKSDGKLKLDGRFFSPAKLVSLQTEFDHWSTIVFEDYLVYAHSLERQFPLFPYWDSDKVNEPN